MCKPVEWYTKLLDGLSRNHTIVCIASGFIVAWWAGEKFDRWNDKMIAIMEKQNAAYVQHAQAIESLSVRVQHVERTAEDLKEWHALEAGRREGNKQ